ncbi:MAG: Na+/H+ antiporter NhaC family protein [Planctomycetota bacterium]
MPPVRSALSTFTPEEGSHGGPIETGANMDLSEYSPVGWLCILPPLLTIVLAILTKRVVLSLVIGIASAVIILMPSPDAYRAALGDEFTWQTFWQESSLQFIGEFFETHLWQSLIDKYHLRVFMFTSLLGMQIALIHRMGGMLGIVRLASPLARTRRGGQVLTWMLGLVVFIDDYANTLLLGSTMRPVTDRLKISREKLAFLVDSTAAPVSGLALVSTWVATEIGNMQVGFENAGVDISGDTFGIFIQTIPSRFYILFALVFVLLCGLFGRDYGPMLAAERRALRDDEENPGPSADDAEQADEVVATKPRAINAVLPIAVTIGVVVWLLVVTGRGTASFEGLPAFSEIQAWGEVIGGGDSYVALVYGAMAGLIVALILNWSQRILSPAQVKSAMTEGFTHVLIALVVLWLAWTLSALTGADYLGTGQFLAAWLEQNASFPVAVLPTIIFLLSAGIAFSTGTSWGTMAIVMPMVIPLVYNLLTKQLGLPEVPPDHYLLTATIGSVLAGAIFGDHCSPISDTTILSSRSSDCDHIAHVRTQMPYAMTIGIVAVLCGTLPAGYGVSAWILLPIGIVVLAMVLLIFGRSPTAKTTT